MGQLNRHSFLRRSFLPIGIGAPTRIATSSRVPEAVALEAPTRRAFIQGTAGAAAGAAVILATPKVASLALDAASPGSAAEPEGVVTKPSGPAPYEPVTAYVRNAEHGEVTVMSGKREITYRDPVLVKRLLDAAR